MTQQQSAGNCFRRSYLQPGCVVLFALILAGCGPSTQPQPDAQVHIQQIAGLYMYYASKHNETGPGSVDELKTWANALPATEKQSFGDGNIEKLFTSPRDNQPYQIVPKVSLKAQTIQGKPGSGSSS